MLDALALAQSRKDSGLLVPAIEGDDHRDWLADGFFGCVSKKSLGAAVPAGNNALQSFADNGIVGRIYDCCEQADCLICLQAQYGNLCQNGVLELVCASFWIAKNATSQCLVRGKKLFDVILELDVRMHSGPIVRRANER